MATEKIKFKVIAISVESLTSITFHYAQTAIKLLDDELSTLDRTKWIPAQINIIEAEK